MRIYMYIYIDQIVINPTATTSYVAKFFLAPRVSNHNNRR